MAATTRQVLAFYVGDRSGQSAFALWQGLPAVSQEQAIFSTDQYAGGDQTSSTARAEAHKAFTILTRQPCDSARFSLDGRR